MKKIIFLVGVLFLGILNSARASDIQIADYHYLVSLCRVSKPEQEACALEDCRSYIENNTVDVGFAPEGCISLCDLARAFNLFKISGFFAVRDASLHPSVQDALHYSNVSFLLNPDHCQQAVIQYIQIYGVDLNFVPEADRYGGYLSLLSMAAQTRAYEVVNFLLANNASTDVSAIFDTEEPGVVNEKSPKIWRYALDDIRVSQMLRRYGVQPQRSDLVAYLTNPLSTDNQLLNVIAYDLSLSAQVEPARAYSLVKLGAQYESDEQIIRALVTRCLPAYGKQLADFLATQQDLSGDQKPMPYISLVSAVLREYGVDGKE